MSDAEAYLRELRRALPIGYRRRFVAEVREHFASAVAAEAERGLEPAEAERLTIERLGPPEALAGQLLDDLRSGAHGRVKRLAVALTTARLVAAGAALAVAVVVAALVTARHSSPAPHAARPSDRSPVVVRTVRTDAARTLVLTVHAVQTRYGLAPVMVSVQRP